MLEVAKKEGRFSNKQCKFKRVSILVVLEVAKKAFTFMQHSGKSSGFNPCCVGGC